MNANRLVFGISALAVLVIIAVMSFETRVDVVCARFWEDVPNAPMFSRQQRATLWPVWDGFGGFALEWGQHEYVKGWVDLGGGETRKVNLIIPDSEEATDWLWIASIIDDQWRRYRELANAEDIDPEVYTVFTAEEIEEAKTWSWDYPMPVWSWKVVFDLPGSPDPIVFGPFFRLGCTEYAMNEVAFPGFKPTLNEK